MTYGCCPKCGSTRIEKSGCFISTACITAKNLPDDCAELTTLRVWRDKLADENAFLSSKVGEYYEYAPVIVEKIDESERSDEVYSYLYDELVLKTVQYLDEGRVDEAIENYLKIYESLKEKYIEAT